MLDAGFGPGEAAFGWMFDPETLGKAMSSGVGATIAVSLGGKLDPEHAGLPIVAQAAKVIAVTDGKYKASTGSVGAGSMVRSYQKIKLCKYNCCLDGDKLTNIHWFHFG